MRTRKLLCSLVITVLGRRLLRLENYDDLSVSEKKRQQVDHARLSVTASAELKRRVADLPTPDVVVVTSSDRTSGNVWPCCIRRPKKI